MAKCASPEKSKEGKIPRPVFLLMLLNAKNGEPIEGKIRLEKLIFKIQKEILDKTQITSSYVYRPYKYGPYTEDTYDDFETLKGLGLADFDESHSRYVITPKGKIMLENLKKRCLINPEWLRNIETIKKTYNELPLEKLLVQIYREYPEYTEKSEIRDILFRG